MLVLVVQLFLSLILLVPLEWHSDTICDQSIVDFHFSTLLLSILYPVSSDIHLLGYSKIYLQYMLLNWFFYLLSRIRKLKWSVLYVCRVFYNFVPYFWNTMYSRKSKYVWIIHIIQTLSYTDKIFNTVSNV